MSNLESASFELEVGAPSSKRPRYDHHTETEILQVEADPNEVDVNTVTITTEEVVPSSQFEIEINSQAEEGDVEEEITQLQAGDLGPNFSIVQDTQEIHTLNSDALGTSELTSEDGTTLNAIGHALIQMQQGGQSQPSSIPQGSQLILTRSSSSGAEPGQNPPLYVMIPPASSAEILHAIGQTRPIAPKSGLSPTGYGPESIQSTVDVAATREAQRKATHNEVERRRRDRINELIKILAQIVPACQKKDASTGSVVGYVYSKGTVLDKTVEYLKELVTQNEQLAASAKIAEKSAGALVLLQNQISVLEKENAFLRAQIIQFGIDAAASSGQKQPSSQPLLTSPLAQSLLNTVVTQSSPSTSVSPPQPSSQQVNNAAAQQLLLSLAQSLTNSPLLTSLSQNQQPSTLQSHGGGVASITTQAPSAYLTSSQLSSVSPIGPSLTTPTGASNSNTPLLSSLVQTLTSMANTTTSPSTPVPKSSPVPQASGGGGLSAAAAANLLNTLILAQNVLTNNSSGGSPVPGSNNTSLSDSIGLETVNVEQSTQ